MKKFWIAFTLVVVVSFIVLSWAGVKIYQGAPPIPEKVATPDNKIVFTKEDIQDGQNIWQALGGMEVGSVWGHGSYVAPDWSADWLHRELIAVLDLFAKEQFNKNYTELGYEEQAALRARLQNMYRKNTYYGNNILISKERSRAIENNIVYYSDIFSNGRNDYAIRKGSLTDPDKLRKLSAFFLYN